LPREVLCSYRRAGVVGPSGATARARPPVAGGDRVRGARSSPDSGVIEGVCERRNKLIRRAPGREDDGMQHVLAANVDVVVIVASIRSPEFSPGLVDRFLVAAQAAGIEPVICVTKMDLWSEGEARPWDIYHELDRELGPKVIEASVRSGAGVDSVRQACLGRTVVFCGRSGAGKTSLLNALMGSEVGRVGDVSAATGKGKHTTTSAVLIGGPEGSHWVDTPGVREFGLVDVAPERLIDFFPELAGKGEEAAGQPRYLSYQRILESLKQGEG
jgi:ribosome biogenesis GTPase